MRRAAIAVLILLMIGVCGCGERSKKEEFDLTGYEQLSEICYVKVDLEEGEGLITVYVYCADDDASRKWFVFSSMVDACWDTIAAIDTMEIFHEKELEGSDFCCIHFDADGDHFVYDSREYIGLNEEEFIEKFPSPIVEYAFREDRYLPDASEQELLEQNIDEKIKNPIIKYADKKLRENSYERFIEEKRLSL